MLKTVNIKSIRRYLITLRFSEDLALADLFCGTQAALSQCLIYKARKRGNGLKVQRKFRLDIKKMIFFSKRVAVH